jgi:serine/threonine protein kinase
MTSLNRLAEALTDRYRIERELGQGGMATVYLAQDIKHHRHVAIKVLHPELSALLGSERFLKEIELTANLQHPHVLPLFDSGEADGLLYYVMPFVDGETLRSRLTGWSIATSSRRTSCCTTAGRWSRISGLRLRCSRPAAAG